MSELEVIQRTRFPVTRHSLVDDLRTLGVTPGMTLLVHGSLSALGWVCGGAVTVIDGLIDLLGEDGTLVMPTHTSHLSDPSFWQNPPVPSDWWPEIRNTMPAFDARTTPSRYVGCLPEALRTRPGCRRSQHPQYSFAALGASAAAITADHPLHFGLGDGSPLSHIYDGDGSVLLLGVDFDRNTSLHLAEHRMQPPVGKLVRNGAPVLRDGQRVWVEVKDRELHDGDFLRLGDRCRQLNWCQTGNVGNAVCHLMPQRVLVDFAVNWFQKHR